MKIQFQIAETRYVRVKSKESALMPNMVHSTSTIVPHPTPCYPPPSLSATHKLRKGRPFIYLRTPSPPFIHVPSIVWLTFSLSYNSLQPIRARHLRALQWIRGQLFYKHTHKNGSFPNICNYTLVGDALKEKRKQEGKKEIIFK